MSEPMFTDVRLAREFRTLEKMIHCYCRGQHGGNALLCAECQELRDYAAARLQRCPFGGQKPTCAKCPIHCYQADRREQMRAMMRYSGPRLLWRHPWLTIKHWLDALRPAPSGIPARH
jgi:hypothetical protein